MTSTILSAATVFDAVWDFLTTTTPVVLYVLWGPVGGLLALIYLLVYFTGKYDKQVQAQEDRNNRKRLQDPTEL